MRVETEIERNGERRSAHETFLPKEGLTASERSARPSWNVRTVGFIAKPGKTHHLAACIESPVTDLLRQMPGFAGVMVLHSRSDPRSLLVLTFWETEKQSATSCWEEVNSVRKAISPMVDVYTKVQTFRAAASIVPGALNEPKAAEFR